MRLGPDFLPVLGIRGTAPEWATGITCRCLTGRLRGATGPTKSVEVAGTPVGESSLPTGGWVRGPSRAQICGSKLTLAMLLSLSGRRDMAAGFIAQCPTS